jgi:hypothetical protein
MPEDFRQVAPPTSKNIEVARVRVAPQLLLDLKRQPLHAAPHVRVARRDPNARPTGKRDQDRSAFNADAINAGDAFAPIRTRASFISTKITPSSASLV